MPGLRRHLRRLRAFTLIELLVVIVILGILMAVALPTFLRQQNKAKDSEAQQYLATSYKVAKGETVGNNNGAYPAVASLVSAIAQSEPELTVSSGVCSSSTGPKNVVVSTTSTSTNLVLCNKSNSGNDWQLAAATSGAGATPTFTNLGLPPAGYQATVLADSPALYWRLNEASGTTAADSSTGGRSGTYGGTIVYGASGSELPSDATNTSVSFDGATAYVTRAFDAGLNSTSSFSVETWIYPTSLATTSYLADNFDGTQTHGWRLALTSSGQLSFQIGDGSTWGQTSTGTGIITTNTWYHVVATYNGTTATVIVNGVQRASGAASYATKTSGALNVGKSGTSFYTGRIDEFALYGTALSCGAAGNGQPCANGSQVYTHYHAA